MKFSFLSIFFLLGALFQIQASGIEITGGTKRIHFSNRGDVSWYEFEIYNSLDTVYSSVKVEIEYSEGIRPLNDRTWRGKSGLSHREYATIETNENRIIFNLPQIQSYAMEKFSAAFVALRRGEQVFQAYVFIQDETNEWIDCKEYFGQLDTKDNLVSETVTQDSLIRMNTLEFDSAIALGENAQLEDNSSEEYLISYKIFKKYFSYLVISIAINLILIICLSTYFIISNIHRKKAGKQKNIKVEKPSSEIDSIQIVPTIELNPELDPDKNSPITNFGSRKYNYLVELIIDNEILERRLGKLKNKTSS